MGKNALKLRAAIALLSRNGCDLTDPEKSERIRADDATFYLGYLEEICDCRLTLKEVLSVAHQMMRESRLDHHAAAAAAAATNAGTGVVMPAHLHRLSRFDLN